MRQLFVGFGKIVIISLLALSCQSNDSQFPDIKLVEVWASEWANSHGCDDKGKLAFKNGVIEVVKGLKNGAEITLNREDEQIGLKPDFEPDFGLPVIYSDVKALCLSDAHDAGNQKALRWFSDKGMFPVNSVLPRICKSIPGNVNLVPLGQGSTNKDVFGNNLFWDKKLKSLVFEGEEGTFSFRRMVLDWTDRSASNSTSLRWAYDSKSKSVFISTTGRSDKNVYQIDFKTGKILSVF